MTIFLLILGLAYLYTFPEFIFISIFTADIILRFYFLVCLNSLNLKFKSDEKEEELERMREDLMTSYGAIEETPSHHVTITLSRDSLNSKDVEVLDGFGDDLRSVN